MYHHLKHPVKLLLSNIKVIRSYQIRVILLVAPGVFFATSVIRGTDSKLNHKCASSEMSPCIFILCTLHRNVLEHKMKNILYFSIHLGWMKGQLFTKRSVMWNITFSFSVELIKYFGGPPQHWLTVHIDKVKTILHYGSKLIVQYVPQRQRKWQVLHWNFHKKLPVIRRLCGRKLQSWFMFILVVKVKNVKLNSL